MTPHPIAMNLDYALDALQMLALGLSQRERALRAGARRDGAFLRRGA